MYIAEETISDIKSEILDYIVASIIGLNPILKTDLHGSRCYVNDELFEPSINFDIINFEIIPNITLNENETVNFSINHSCVECLITTDDNKKFYGFGVGVTDAFCRSFILLFKNKQRVNIKYSEVIH